jgi:cardiolipin synthase
MGTLLHSSRWLTLHGLVVVVGLLIYVLTTHSLKQRRAPTAAISWTLSIALLPYIGLPLYLLFGTRKLVHAANRNGASAPAAGEGADAWPRLLAASMGQPPAATYRKLRLHAEGHHALQALWELIDSAERELLVCTFLIGRDAVGEALMARLGEQARRGVRVRLLLDGSGHLMGGAVNLRALRAAGVEVAVYGPLLHVPFRSRVNLRNHRKLVVADGARLWCGGRNFAVEYFDGSNRHGRWRDLTFDLEGPLAAQARALFLRDWAFSVRGAGAREPVAPLPVAPAVEEAGRVAGPLAQVIASGPDESDDTLHDLLVSACFKAQRRIMAATPYFVPGGALLMALSLAARRGVTVDLVLPAHSNHRMADFVRHRAIRDLAAAGGRVWLAPCMLHAKAVVIDDGLALAGSANLDARSMFLNYEMMVAFYAGEDIRRFAEFIEKHRASAVRYEARKPGLVRDLGEGLLLWLAFQL